MHKNRLRLTYACYTSNATMAAVSTLSPMLFLTFRNLYGISYSSLGLLVLINFVTQLLVDLIISFFSHKFDIPKTLRAIPVMAVVGFLIYALWPFLAPGSENWPWLALIVMLLPLLSAFLFFGSDIPEMETPKQTSAALKLLTNKSVWLCVLAIFLGGAAECTMSQWSSSYFELAVGIPKIWGDLLGVALFSVALGMGRTLYSKNGKNIHKTLTWGIIGTTVCYVTVAVTGIPWVGIAACVLCGFCVSMCWPGNLMVASEKFAQSGVFIYAIMAAGGDLGASVGPQLVGIVTDAVIAAPAAQTLAAKLSLTAEQLGMRAGLLGATVFPLAGIFVYLWMWKHRKTEE